MRNRIIILLFELIILAACGSGGSTNSTNSSTGDDGGGTTTLPASGVLFTDNFDSGKSVPQNGVSYGSSTPTVTAANGKLEFLFRGKPVGQDSFAEQRIQLGRRLQEIWIAYDVSVPANYTHRSDNPSNNKLIAIYADPYEQPGFQVNFSGWASSGLTSLAFHSYGSNGENPIKQSGTMFIGASDLGKTMRVKIHITTNGVAQMWKNGTLIADYSGLDFSRPERIYIDALYVFGWANSGFDIDTVLVIDNLVISETEVQ